MHKHAHLVLRIGVAFSFLYAAVDSLAEPFSWIDYIPQFATNIAPALTLLRVFGIAEIILALWILSGYKIVIPSTLAGLILVAIVLFNLSEFQLLFRDLSIAAAAFVLAFESYRSGHAQKYANPT